MDDQKTQQSIDWNLCVFCQVANNINLVSPKQGYSSVARNWERWEQEIPVDLEQFPHNTSRQSLSVPQGQDLASYLAEKHAKWHKICELKINNKNIERIISRKRKISEETGIQNQTCYNKKKRCKPENGNLFPIHCFICKHDKKENLRSVSYADVDTKIKACAKAQNDFELLAKIGSSDLMALEAKYHRSCLTIYLREGEEPTKGDQRESKAFSELVSYIEETFMEYPNKVFRLKDLVDLYDERLKQLGIDRQNTGLRTHSTRLKEKLLKHVSHLVAHNKSKNVYITSNVAIASMLQENFNTNYDEINLSMSKVASRIRSTVYESDTNSEIDTLLCEFEIPYQLKTFVTMILYGANIKDQVPEASLTPAVNSLSQLLIFNMQKKPRDPTKLTTIRGQYHHINNEMPIPLYTGLKVHAVSKKKQLIECLFKMGLSVSYSRVQDIVTALAHNVCRQYNQESVVCPPQMRKRVFTIGAFDNFDSNPTSTTAYESTHSTTVSLFQNMGRYV